LAISVARQTGASVHLVHVHIPSGNTEGEERAYLDGVAARVATRSPDIRLATEIIAGSQRNSGASALVRYAGETRADLLVLSSHERGGLGRWWFGNVADDLVRQTSLPLLVTHPAGESTEKPEEPALRHILVALDGSPLAERILTPVLALGVCPGAEY